MKFTFSLKNIAWMAPSVIRRAVITIWLAQLEGMRLVTMTCEANFDMAHSSRWIS